VSPKNFAIAALVLGIAGLFTAGGLIVGSLLGLVLAAAALVRGGDRSARDVAWAAVAANVFALVTILPLAGAAWLIRTSPVPILEAADDSLPEPAQPPLGAAEAFVAPPPPPPPPSTAPEAKREVRRDSPAATRGRPVVEPPSPAASPAATPVAPVRVGGAIAEPRKTRHVSPTYPADALQARLQGTVILECTIDVEGAVADVRVLRGQPLLTEAAVEAVRQWTYEPTRLNGVAVPVVMTVTVNFRLS
jgi:TonB family protein